MLFLFSITFHHPPSKTSSEVLRVFHKFFYFICVDIHKTSEEQEGGIKLFINRVDRQCQDLRHEGQQLNLYYLPGCMLSCITYMNLTLH